MRFQKNYWYEYSTPPSTSYPSEYIDYHLSSGGSDPSSALRATSSSSTPSPNLPRFVHLEGETGALDNNVTTQLGASATLSCLVANLQDKTVSEHVNVITTIHG